MPAEATWAGIERCASESGSPWRHRLVFHFSVTAAQRAHHRAERALLEWTVVRALHFASVCGDDVDQAGTSTSGMGCAASAETVEKGEAEKSSPNNSQLHFNLTESQLRKDQKVEEMEGHTQLDATRPAEEQLNWADQPPPADHEQQLEHALAQMLRGKAAGGFKESRQTQRFAREGGGDWTAFVKLEVEAWWSGLYFGKEKNEDFDLAHKDCLHALRAWPRGHGAGELLFSPQVDETPIDKRGVTAEWCVAAFDWLGSIAAAGPHTVSHLPTRVFVGALIKLMTAQHECALFFFVPPQFRGVPSDFISHSWDCTLRSLLYGHVSPCRWLDFIVINQHHPDAEVRQIGEIVKGCRRTVVVMEGMADSHYALRPALRSWCVYEITHTPKDHLQMQIGIFTWQPEYHRVLADAIACLSIQRAEALQTADKEMIDDLVLRKYGTWDAANRDLRLLMLDAFADWYLGEQDAVARSIARVYEDKAEALRRLPA